MWEVHVWAGSNLSTQGIDPFRRTRSNGAIRESTGTQDHAVGPLRHSVPLSTLRKPTDTGNVVELLHYVNPTSCYERLFCGSPSGEQCVAVLQV
jgi:hypothetical protein